MPSAHWAIRITAAVLLTGTLVLGQTPAVRIGISIDGPWEQNDVARDAFQREIGQLLARQYDVTFPENRTLVGNWTASRVANQLDSLLAADDVDYVIALGVLSSNEAARRGLLPKPVFAPFVINPLLEGVPYEEIREPRPDAPGDAVYHVSGRENLSYTVVGTDLEREVSKFLEITPFQRLTILIMKAMSDGIPGIGRSFEEQLDLLNLDVTIVTV